MKILSRREWYSVPVSAVRRGVLIGVLLLVSGVGYLVFKQWQRYDLQQRAIQTAEQAQDMIDQLESRDDFVRIKAENAIAWDRLDVANKALVDGDYEAAYSAARQSLLVLRSVNAGNHDGSIVVLSVQGGVEHRRGERGAWKRAREQDRLSAGDWVKTGDSGSAEIVFDDGTLYTLRPGTLVRLGGPVGSTLGPEDEGTAKIVFGAVDLDTADRGSRVTTPRAEARVREDSEAMVAYDRDRQESRFAAFEGGAEVRVGENSRELGRLQQIEERDGQLGPVTTLPPRPVLLRPSDSDEVNLDDVDRLTLAWQAVRGGSRYRLEVSDSRLFGRNLVADANRRKTSALLGLKREGNYYWKVAAIGRSSAQGPWSETRSFRVASLAGSGLVTDETPPPLEILEAQTYGSLVIVKGRTEPGASVTVNGELVIVASDGAFDKTIQMTREGWVSVEIVARDVAGNTSRARRRVRIEVF